MCKILITGIGGDIAQSISTIIRKESLPARLIGADANDDIPWRSFVDDFFKVSMASSESYLPMLDKIISEQSVDILIPLSEPELEIINDARTIKNWSPTKILMVPSHILSIFLDKLETAKFLVAKGIPMPWTKEVESNPDSLPCILKHRFGSGSTGLATIENREDLGYFRKRRKGWILQELLLPEDKEYTCGLYSEDGQNILVIVMKRILEHGLSRVAEVIHDQEIVRLCKKVGSLVNLRGSINIQLRKTPQGPRIFEINPRFSSTAIFRNHLGFKDVIWSIKEALEIKHEIKFNYRKAMGKKFYRIYSEVFTA